jgi:hypothetical protein
MKTKTYLGLTVAVILSFMASCSNQSAKSDASASTEEMQTNGATEDAQTNGIVSQAPPIHTIPISDIKEMIGKYRTERQEMINKNDGLKRSYGENFTDTRCAWFSISELKAFIAESEKNPKNRLSGIRMYYTVYPEKKEGESEYMRSIPEKDRNHVSLLLVPTYYDDQNKCHNDFGPSDVPVGQSSTPGGNKEDQKSRSASAIAPSQQSAPAMNHASLCPPNCPTAVPEGYLNN